MWARKVAEMARAESHWSLIRRIRQPVTKMIDAKPSLRVSRKINKVVNSRTHTQNSNLDSNTKLLLWLFRTNRTICHWWLSYWQTIWYVGIVDACRSSSLILRWFQWPVGKLFGECLSAPYNISTVGCNDLSLWGNVQAINKLSNNSQETLNRRTTLHRMLSP